MSELDSLKTYVETAEEMPTKVRTASAFRDGKKIKLDQGTGKATVPNNKRPETVQTYDMIRRSLLLTNFLKTNKLRLNSQDINVPSIGMEVIPVKEISVAVTHSKARTLQKYLQSKIHHELKAAPVVFETNGVSYHRIIISYQPEVAVNRWMANLLRRLDSGTA